MTPYVGLDELSGVWAFGFFGRPLSENLRLYSHMTEKTKRRKREIARALTSPLSLGEEERCGCSWLRGGTCTTAQDPEQDSCLRQPPEGQVAMTSRGRRGVHRCVRNDQEGRDRDTSQNDDAEGRIRKV